MNNKKNRKMESFSKEVLIKYIKSEFGTTEDYIIKNLCQIERDLEWDINLKKQDEVLDKIIKFDVANATTDDIINYYKLREEYDRLSKKESRMIDDIVKS